MKFILLAIGAVQCAISCNEQFEIVKPYLKSTATKKYNPLKMGNKIINSIIKG